MDKGENFAFGSKPPNNKGVRPELYSSITNGTLVFYTLDGYAVRMNPITNKYYKEKIKGPSTNFVSHRPGTLIQERKHRTSYAEETARQIRANSMAFHNDFDSLIPDKFITKFSDDFLNKPMPNLSKAQIQKITQRVNDEHRTYLQQILQENMRKKELYMKQKQKQSQYDNLPVFTKFTH